jgi:hypothetical protein
LSGPRTERCQPPHSGPIYGRGPPGRAERERIIAGGQYPLAPLGPLVLADARKETEMSAVARLVPQLETHESRASLPLTPCSPHDRDTVLRSRFLISEAVVMVRNSKRRLALPSSQKASPWFVICPQQVQEFVDAGATTTSARRCIQLAFTGPGSLMKAIHTCASRTGIPPSYWEAWWYGRGGNRVLTRHRDTVFELHKIMLRQRRADALMEELGLDEA